MSRPALARKLALVAALTCAPLPAAAPPLPPAAAVHGRYVVLGSAGGETVAYARAVIEPGYSCPRVAGGPAAVAMTTRDNPHSFPVIVCEAVIGFDQDLELEIDGAPLALPTVRRNPSRVVVFGDTGCKAPQPGTDEGCAAGSPAEPFASLTRAVARGPAPDLILHVGDYNYRGTGGEVLFTVEQDGKPAQVAEWPYDAGDGTTAAEHCEQDAGARFWNMNAASSNRPDTWAAWRDDFFSAAADLLPRAPWVVARGNHELCSKAGPGWFYFLDPGSNLTGAQLGCPEPDPSAAPAASVVLTEPYALDLGTLTLLVLDSANACDFFTVPAFTARYEEQFRRLAELAPKAGTVWLVSHRPLWGVTGLEAGKTTPCTAESRHGCINQTLQAAVGGALGGKLPAAVDLLLAGHMHRFQSLTFPDAGRPPVVIVGNGGVELETYPPIGSFAASVGGLTANALSLGAKVDDGGTSKNAFGYLEIQLGDDGTWSGAVRNPPESLTMAECSSAAASGGRVCRLASGVEPGG